MANNNQNSFITASTPTPVFGTAGSRRTVYVADDDPNVNLNTKPQSTPIKENPPTYLVYNRISTVIGDGACQNINDRSTSDRNEPPRNVDENVQDRDESRNDLRVNNHPEKNDNSKESAIWYEYGCV